MNDSEFATQDANHDRLELQSTYTRFLKGAHQKASAENARLFAKRLTHGNTTKFRGMSQEQIYKVLTGNNWPRN
jgi:hypothetical protein